MLGRIVWFGVASGPAGAVLSIGAAGLYGAYCLGAHSKKKKEENEALEIAISAALDKAFDSLTRKLETQHREYLFDKTRYRFV